MPTGSAAPITDTSVRVDPLGDNSEPADYFNALRDKVDNRVIFDAIDNQGQNDWRGRDETWTELFDRLGGRDALR
jgi:hypothetical protein